MKSDTPKHRPRAISNWLLAVAALVFLMVVIGGITRLTESGLSMVRWEPISGIVPPLNAAEWQAEFDAYKAYPEYQLVNRGMSLSEFKNIFFWEYLHRALGRIIGLAFALPLIVFWVRGAIPPGYKPRLLVLLALGGMQGVIGWWMVVSGLADRPDVSHLRLAAHLLTAFVILAALVWTALDLRKGTRARLVPLAGAAFAVLFVQMLLGAFVAGMDAGYAFAEWPLMGGQFFPQDPGWLTPFWRNAVDHPIIVQWIHRWWAFAAAAMLVWLAVRAMRGGARAAPILVKIFLVLQILLGIGVLLSGVEIVVATLHQAVAALLLVAATWTAHSLGRTAPTGSPR